jgi:CheY-like chemotaxis protein
VTSPARRRILLADDDPDLRALLSEVLREEGYDVLIAESGVQLLDLIGPALLGWSDDPPAELVVSDLRMPGLTGLSVLGGLRELNWQMPFILITAFADDHVRQQAERLGALVLDKPFELRQLRDLLQQALRPH